MRFRRRVKRTRQGTYRLDLPDVERDVLGNLLPQLRQLVAGEDPDGRARRLFPVAYPDDREAETEYQHFMREELVDARLAAIDTMAGTLGATSLDEAQLHAWMGAVNALRLVLGTLLDVSEDLDLAGVPDDHPDIQSYAIYSYLGYLLEELVQAAMD